MSKEDAHAAINYHKMTKLRFSCSRWWYYGTENYPLIRLDRKRTEYVHNEDYRQLIGEEV